ncbi:RNA-binding protein [Bacillus dakarensis]|uniref:YlmH family RNA-binding protein n=1 Tax=Robertmurraya dakarensis TaxID=1926278 RepID=UPI000981BD0B|nr:RNA-binding protein [Bacillus dakarensis]
MDIYQHFRKHEREFIDQVLQWKMNVEDTYSPKLTDFLDPREQEIVRTIIGSQGVVKVEFFGGAADCERKRAFVFPEYIEAEQEDFRIVLFEIEYPKKFVTIEHPQVLGSLMSLGLKRSKFGDILTEDSTIHFFVNEEVSDYIKLQLTSIGRSSVSLKELPLNQAIGVKSSWQEMTTTVSSLRLDALVSAIYNISRQKSQTLIGQGLVKLNWTSIENPAVECGVADVLSVRGHGRAKLISIEGKTKKDKWRIVAGKQR